MRQRIIKGVFLALLSWTAFFCVAQMATSKPAPQQDLIVNFRIPLSKTQQIIYAIRYSSVLDAKTANEIADLLVNQGNDTILNKQLMPQVKQK